MSQKTLMLYEQILLLALRDHKGTVSTEFVEHAMAGAVLTELLLEGRIRIDDTRRQTVVLSRPEPLGDPLLDECLTLIRGRKKPQSLKRWVSKVAASKRLYHRVAGRLCDKSILKREERRFLWVFRRTVYPQLDPEPERAIVARIEAAVSAPDESLEPRTAVLISLAHGANLLRENFGREWVKANAGRIEAIAAGQMVGQATSEVIEACKAAVVVAATSAMVATSVN